VSDSVRPHRRQPTRLPCPWDSLGKNTGVGCHFLLQYMKVKSDSEVSQSCPTLSDPMDCSPPGSSVHGIFLARVLEWGAIAFSGLLWSLLWSPLKIFYLFFFFKLDCLTRVVSELVLFWICGWYKSFVRYTHCKHFFPCLWPAFSFSYLPYAKSKY